MRTSGVDGGHPPQDEVVLHLRPREQQRQIEPARKHHANWLAIRAQPANGQARVVGADGAEAVVLAARQRTLFSPGGEDIGIDRAGTVADWTSPETVRLMSSWWISVYCEGLFV